MALSILVSNIHVNKTLLVTHTLMGAIGVNVCLDTQDLTAVLMLMNACSINVKMVLNASMVSINILVHVYQVMKAAIVKLTLTNAKIPPAEMAASVKTV